MQFRNRQDAGEQLAQLLAREYKGCGGIVYPLPRGGVPLGIVIAETLELPLDLIIPRKIGHPFNPEYAICAVAEDGETVCNEQEASRVDPGWLKQRVKEERAESQRRRNAYLANREAVPLKGKTAILVDDGIATGLTMRAAIRDARFRQAARVIVAIPVAPQDTADRLMQEVDDVVAVSIDPNYLGAVGAYYNDFSQLTDKEVIDMLRKFHQQQADAKTFDAVHP